MTDRLSPLDASFLEIEEQDEASHMHIGWAMVFDPLPEGGAPSIDRVSAQLEPRLGAVPRFGARLSAPRTGGLSWPRWVSDDRFDIADHVRQAVLPAPGGEAELLEWLGDFWSHRLDRSRPLWELVLLEGLAGERWALVTKTHHCLVDGMSGVDVTNLLLDATPEPPPGPDARDGAVTSSADPAPRSRVGRAAGAAVAGAPVALDGAVVPATRQPVASSWST